MSRDLTSLAPLRADSRVRYGEDESQFFDVWRSRRPASLGAAVMIHGGFWRARYDLSHASHMCAALAGNGIAVANLEYRRVGHVGGGWPGTFEDVVAGVRAASEHLGEAPVVLGHSAGGHLALRLAAEAGERPTSASQMWGSIRLRGVVALAPVADLQKAYELNLSNGAVVEFLGGTPETLPDCYQAACASRHSASIRRVLVHGTVDDVVPVSLSRAFVEARKDDPEPPVLIEVPQAGHFEVIDPQSGAWPIVLDSVLGMMQV